jgi:hypothetical protein
MHPSNQRRGISIRMFLADGTPDGLKLVEKSNWNGLAVMCARADYPQARQREEFSRPGVYVLVSPSPDLAGRQSLYIGQADLARERLDQHLRTRDAWTHVILFVSRDTTLNKAHVQYLESRLIELAQRARRADLENGNAPRIPFLSEADRADADAFLDDMLIIYPILGVTAFERHAAPLPADRPPRPSAGRLYLNHGGAKAEGEDAAEGFTVFAGAIARAHHVPSIHKYMLDLRQELISTGVLVSENDVLRLTQDYPFSSPSTAAGVLMGRSANGRLEWKDALGRTLKSLQEEALERTESSL